MKNVQSFGLQDVSKSTTNTPKKSLFGGFSALDKFQDKILASIDETKEAVLERSSFVMKRDVKSGEVVIDADGDPIFYGEISKELEKERKIYNGMFNFPPNPAFQSAASTQ
jgi:hypothetical protein